MSESGPGWSVIVGDCREVLKRATAGSFDSIVTDPPYELGFMGKGWDQAGVAFDPATWRECFRVLKPGGHLLAFGGTRTYHRMAVAIEDAGFEIRDSIHWMYGSGFPKSLNVAKAADRPDLAGMGTALKPAHEPIVVARKSLIGTVAENVLQCGTGGINVDACRVDSGPSSSVARRQTAAPKESIGATGWVSAARPPEYNEARPGEMLGRWPPNVLFTHSAGCRVVGARKVKSGVSGANTEADKFRGAARDPVGYERSYNGPDGLETIPAYECTPGCPVAELDAQSGAVGAAAPVRGTEPSGVFGARGIFNPMPRKNAGPFYGDTGGASRFFPALNWDPALDDVAPFFYAAKASRKEREAGLEDRPAVPVLIGAEGHAINPVTGRPVVDRPRANVHPTVKPVAVMRWLVRLVTPPGGRVLDPFAGSGTTGVAARLEGRRFVGVELGPEYAEIAGGRIRAVVSPEPPAGAAQSTLPIGNS